MKRRIVFCLFVASLFDGCYYARMVTNEELKAKTEQSDITVCAKDSSEYKFSKGNYSILGDTLLGFGVHTIGGIDGSFHGAISFADITSHTTDEFDLTATLVAIGLPVGLVVGFLFALAAGMSKI